MRTSEEIRDLSVAAYKIRLEQSSPGAVERMLEKDADGGKKLRGRAEAYDPLTRAYLQVLSTDHKLSGIEEVPKKTP